MESAVGQILAGSPELDVRPHVPAGLRLLHDAGLRRVAPTNGSLYC